MQYLQPKSYIIWFFCFLHLHLLPVTRSENFLHEGESRSHEADPLHGGTSYRNLTHKDMANLLRSRGYTVREFPDEKPLVLMGDVAYHPEQIMPELAEGRFTGITGTNIWVKNGVAKSWYFFDTSSNADKKVFKAAVKTWADVTCIQFEKLPDGPCTTDVGHGCICVGNYVGCWSLIGNTYKSTGKPQKMSVQPNGCELVAAAHEFGHALGNQHQQSKPDRDKYMYVKNENFECPIDKSKQGSALASTWMQGGRCNKDQVVDLPVPFDYLSLMQYMTSSFTDEDFRPVFVTKDGHFQYLLDYHRFAGIVQSFYDQYSVNTVYGCVKYWIKGCSTNSKHVPKCKNLGFLGKDCKCHCPPAFKGASCETKIGPLFPLLAKANMVEVAKDQLVDWSKYKMRTDKGDAVLEGFNLYQYFSIIAHGPDEKQKVTISTLPRELPSVFTSGQIQSWLLGSIDQLDCTQGTRVLWGLSKLGNLRRECTSTMANNEPIGPMFRSRTNHLDFIYFSSAGAAGSDPQITIDLMKFKMQFTFEDSPLKHLKTQRSPTSGPGDSGDGDGDGDGSGGSNGDGNGAEAQVEEKKKKNIGIGVGIAVAVLLLLGGAAGAAIWYQKRQAKKSPETGAEGDVAEGESESETSTTDSDSDDDDDNTGDADDAGDAGNKNANADEEPQESNCVLL